ncbi:MAG: F0F1 ATP synthase subunit B [Acidobacteria bacterium]|nr:F0F1 ATP synthase subunit B [Acidobacteriota bacterium]
MLALVRVLAEAAATDVQGATEEAAKNPILPTINEMFWAAVVFLLLWALMKYVLLPPITKVLAARADAIRGDLQAAEAAEAQRSTRLADYEAGLAGARAEAVGIIEQARSEGDAERRVQISAADAEVAALRSEAAAEIAAAKARARTELTSSIADIAVGAAEAVVQRPIDRAAQTALVEDYVRRSGSQN